MGEEPKNENKPEFKGDLGVIWLIGILVILLGCTVVYVLNMREQLNTLKANDMKSSAILEQEKEYSYKDLDGVYKSENEEDITYKGETFQGSIFLDLNKEGQFYCHFGRNDIHYAFYGKYTINKEKITKVISENKGDSSGDFHIKI